jgi:hypothetical protein
VIFIFQGAMQISPFRAQVLALSHDLIALLLDRRPITGNFSATRAVAPILIELFSVLTQINAVVEEFPAILTNCAVIVADIVGKRSAVAASTPKCRVR